MTYDLIVIGGGAAGLTASETANMLGLKTALIEQQHIGGDCTWTGCVPSKALLAAAHIAHTARSGGAFGVHAESVTINFAEVIAHVRQTVQDIYHEESPDKLRAKGMDVFIAKATFEDPHSVRLSTGERLAAKAFIIAIGAKTVVDPLFSGVAYRTHESLFELTELPHHLVIVGGGAVSVEMAQAFIRLGSAVTLVTRETHLLSQADPDASQAIATQLQQEGVRIIFETHVREASGQEGDIHIRLQDGQTLKATHLLLALGKQPDVRGLAPENAKLALNGTALMLTETLQTSQKHIFAVGDVSGAPYFTHVAGSEAIVGMLNLLLPFKSKRNPIVPFCIFTDPEVAQVGLTEAQARTKFNEVHVTRVPMTAVDRAMTDGKRDGFIKVVHSRYGIVYGVVIVGYRAGEMMNEWIPLVASRRRLSAMIFASHIYPTMGYSNVIPAIEFVRHVLKNTQLGRLIRQVVRWLAR